MAKARRQSNDVVDGKQPLLEVVYIKHQVTSGTASGNTVASSWVTRPLTIKEGVSSNINLSSNLITLSPGTYDIEIKACSNDADITPGVGNYHRLRLYNVTDSSEAILGMNNGGEDTATASVGVGSILNVMGSLTLSSSKTFRLEHYCNRNNTNGFGKAQNQGFDEVFATVKITKVG